MKMLQELNTRFKLTYCNDDIDYTEFRNRVMMPEKQDAYNVWRKEINGVKELRMKEGRQGVATTFYFTISVHRNTYDEAKNYFLTLNKTLERRLFRMGSYLVPYNCSERMKVLHDFYNYGRPGKQPEYHFDFDETVELARDFLDELAPDSFQPYDSYFELNRSVGRILYVKDFPSDLTDRFLQKLTDFPYHIWVSVDGEPLNREMSMKLIDQKYRFVEEKIDKQQQTRNRNRSYSSDISKNVLDEKVAVGDIIDAFKKQNMTLYYCGVTIAVFADNLDELDMRTNALFDAAAGESVTLSAERRHQYGGTNRHPAMQ